MHSSNTCSWTNAERNPGETEQRSTWNCPSPPTWFVGAVFIRMSQVIMVSECEKVISVSSSTGCDDSFLLRCDQLVQSENSGLNVTLVWSGGTITSHSWPVSKVNWGCTQRSSCVEGDFHGVPPTKASPAPFVSTISFWSMSKTGNTVTFSPVVRTQEGGLVQSWKQRRFFFFSPKFWLHLFVTWYSKNSSH